MTLKYFLPLVALGLTAFAIGHALSIQQPQPPGRPPVPPPLTPFGDTVAGAGIVESSTEASGTGNIAIGSQLAGTVVNVAVRIGQEVKAGDLLFELDSRQTEADLAVREANVPVSEAQVEVAKANLRQAQDQFERASKLVKTGAVTEQDFIASEQAYRAAEAQLKLSLANVKEFQAQVEQDRTTLKLLKVRAPVDGAILQINVRPGEYVSTFGGQSLILMGNLTPLHVRVNVDEEDLPRLKLDAPATAKIRGDVRQEVIPLSFVRLEPYVVPKASLTGANTERVDTRVVQLIYAVDSQSGLVREKKVLVGQLVDVFIDTRPVSDATAAQPEGAQK